MSIVDKYIDKHGNNKKAAAKINKACGSKHRDTEVTGMRSGRRGVSIPTLRVMLKDCLHDIILSFGYKHKDGDISKYKLDKLIEEITPPEPKK